MNNPFYVGIVGSRSCTPEIAGLAYETGKLVAEQGWMLVCGGMGGVMEQACRGAHSAGGITLGILPGNSREEGNPYLSYSIVTGLGEARNVLVAKTSQALIAISGSYGTLSEIALANTSGIPVVGLKSWHLDPQLNRGRHLFSKEVEDPREAIDYIKSLH
ncbi:hypothetical protein ES703_74889 [subsurface metagenome]